MKSGFQLAKLEETRELVRAALALAVDERVVRALQASLEQFDRLLGDAASEQSRKYAGSIVYTIDDEDHSRHCQQFELRVHYHWIDYDPLDEPYPLWGPTLEAVDVIAVRCFDDDGDEISLDEHQRTVAWDLVQADYERVTEACKRAGVIEGIGVAPSWYNPGPAAAPPKMRVVTHMARSASTRSQPQQRRQHG